MTAIPGWIRIKPDVLDRIVADAVVAVLEAAADTDDPDRKAVRDRPVADHLVRPQGCERPDRVAIRDESRLREAGGHADHVLLGDTNVHKSIRTRLCERFERHVAEVAGEEHDPIVRRADLRQCR